MLSEYEVDDSVVLRAGSNVAFTTRLGGVSETPFHTLNLSYSVGDDPELVSENRRRVSGWLEVDPEWKSARQVHGAEVSIADGRRVEDADAVVTSARGAPVAVFTADCLPIALVGDAVVGAVHAGWRGLVAGVIGRAVAACPGKLTAVIGPSIGPCHYETGLDVPRAFANAYPEAPDFTRRVGGRVHFDLWSAGRWQLEMAGVGVGPSDPPCTYCDDRFFSHRREGTTGRQALVVWR